MASYVAPALQEKFESLSTELKDCILEHNVRLNTLQDLIQVLEKIVAENNFSSCQYIYFFSFLFPPPNESCRNHHIS